MKKNQIDIITLGCAKNLGDSELLMKQFEGNGYHCVHDSKRPQGEIAVINTCGFIEDAKKESIVSERKEEQFDKLCEEWKEADGVKVHKNVWDKISFVKRGVTIKDTDE